MIATSQALVGPDRLICPDSVGKIYVSPRHRALETLKLLEGGNDFSEAVTTKVSTTTARLSMFGLILSLIKKWLD